MKISEIYQRKKVLSFEVFPPKTIAGMENLFKELEVLKSFNPDYFSITYGAGGSTQEKTLDLALNIKAMFETEVLVHFTCVGSNRDDIGKYLHSVRKNGIDNILALRGDPPTGVDNFVKPADGFEYANELIEYIGAIENFDIAVAGYPEGHPEATSIDDDIINLKKKIDAGGNYILSQLFFDNSLFYQYLEKVKKSGITIPIIPGIMPIISRNQIDRILKMCQTKIPNEMNSVLNSDVPDSEIEKYGIEFCIKQCEDLIKNGIKDFHFYPLNKSKSISNIIPTLNIKS